MAGKSENPRGRISEEHAKFFLDGAKEICSFCDDAGFSMTKIPLQRLLRIADTDRGVDFETLGHLYGNALERLRDEASAISVFRISSDKVKYYDERVPMGDSVSDSFPSTAFDAVETYRCFALNRNTACVFHLMRIMEIGLCTFADRFNVSSDHTNWHNIIESIEKAVREMANNPNRPVDWKDQQEFFSQSASHFMVMKDAWRNYTAHRRGKYTDEEAETLLINVRGFMQKLATRLHE